MTKIEKLWEFMKQKKIDKYGEKYNDEIKILPRHCESFIKESGIYYNFDAEEYYVYVQFNTQSIRINDEGFPYDYVEECNKFFNTNFKNEKELFDATSEGDLDDAYNYIMKKEYGDSWDYYEDTLLFTINNANNYASYVGEYYMGLHFLDWLCDYRKEFIEFLQDETKLDENFIYEKLEGDKLIENKGSDDAIHITVKSYKDKQTLFDIKQEKDEDDLHFYVRIENGRETFEYSRKIETQEDFCKALEQTINALENYSEFYEQRDELKEILEKFN